MIKIRFSFAGSFKKIFIISVIAVSTSISSFAFYIQKAIAEEELIWINNAQFNFWIKKPMTWRRDEPNPANDLAERFLEPVRIDAFVEVYANNNMPANMSSDMLADALEQKGVSYLQQRVSSEPAYVSALPAVMRKYTSFYQNEPLIAYALSFYNQGKAVMVVGVFKQSMAYQFERLVRESMMSLSLKPPEQGFSAELQPVSASTYQPAGGSSFSVSTAQDTGFTLHIPSGWTDETEIKGAGPIIKKARKNDEPGISVVIFKMEASRFPSNNMDEVISALGQYDVLLGTELSRMNLYIDGGTGISKVFLGAGKDGNSIKTMVNCIKVNDIYYVIIGSVPQKKSEKQWDEIDSIVNSFSVSQR
ncbi:MAG: hypothetical protein KBB52_07530 [Candidatus Omnitrophica bacterium]|nr:hypothetical protein [Candidatus Omnitrophota bacterium]